MMCISSLFSQWAIRDIIDSFITKSTDKVEPRELENALSKSLIKMNERFHINLSNIDPKWNDTIEKIAEFDGNIPEKKN